MKKMQLLLSALLLSTGVLMAQERAKIEFNEKVYDYGSIPEMGGDVKGSFTIYNRGNAPLIITHCNASCGCTVPNYPKAPIAPGDSAQLEVTYRPKYRPGAFLKSVYVYSNAGNEHEIVKIKGVVIADSEKEQ